MKPQDEAEAETRRLVEKQLQDEEDSAKEAMHVFRFGEFHQTMLYYFEAEENKEKAEEILASHEKRILCAAEELAAFRRK